MRADLSKQKSTADALLSAVDRQGFDIQDNGLVVILQPQVRNQILALDVAQRILQLH